MKKNKILYTINYDKIVDFKERVTRFTVRFKFKRSENEKYFKKSLYKWRKIWYSNHRGNHLSIGFSDYIVTGFLFFVNLKFN